MSGEEMEAFVGSIFRRRLLVMTKTYLPMSADLPAREQLVIGAEVRVTAEQG